MPPLLLVWGPQLPEPASLAFLPCPWPGRAGRQVPGEEGASPQPTASTRNSRAPNHPPAPAPSQGKPQALRFPGAFSTSPGHFPSQLLLMPETDNPSHHPDTCTPDTQVSCYLRTIFPHNMAGNLTMYPLQLYIKSYLRAGQAYGHYTIRRHCALAGWRLLDAVF